MRLKSFKIAQNEMRNTDNKCGKDSRKRKVEKNIHGLPGQKSSILTIHHR
jgi:hypothetical protein